MSDKKTPKYIPPLRIKMMGVLVKLENGDVHQVVLSDNAISDIKAVILSHYDGVIYVREEKIKTVDLVAVKKENQNERRTKELSVPGKAERAETLWDCF